MIAMKYGTAAAGMLNSIRTGIEVQVLPNPASRVISVTGFKSRLKQQVSIIDMWGKEVLKSVLEPGSKSQVDISGLGNGVYTVIIQNDRETAHARFLKQ
jgi:hypothetical protein